MEHVDTLVIGAGVIGLSVARELSMAGHDVVVAEAAGAIGTGMSARNSEVVHAGIYYPRGSLKATLCVSGRHLLYEYCARRNVPFRRCGKLIVATSSTEAATLASIALRAAANGVTDLRVLERGEALAVEPELECSAALESPSTGIVDAHALMQRFVGDAEDHGAAFALRSRITRAELTPAGLRVEVDTDGSSSTVLAENVVNAAGLFAPSLARAFEGLDSRFVPEQFFAKGSYFALRAKAPFSRLIYPTPSQGGLGVHLTLDLAGQARFGPDVEWLDGVSAEELRFDVDGARGERFYEAVRRYWPRLADGALAPDYAGVRPKLVPKGAPDADFVVQGPLVHGVRGLVNLFGIESPGLTASLSIATLVRTLLDS